MEEVVDAEREWGERTLPVNPFDNKDSASRSDRKKKKKKRRKKKNRKLYTSEEISETETLLDELLSFEDEDVTPKKMIPVSEDFCDEDSLGVAKSSNQNGINPFNDLEEEEDYGNEYDKEGYDELLGKKKSLIAIGLQTREKTGHSNQCTDGNSFMGNAEQEKKSKNSAISIKQRKETEQMIQDAVINPFESEGESVKPASSNQAENIANRKRHQPDTHPFEKSENVGNDAELERNVLDENSSVDSENEINSHNPFDDEVKDSDEMTSEDETEKESRYVLVKKGSYERIVAFSTQNPADERINRQSSHDMSGGSAPETELDEGEESDEDIVESSKRLLRMADKRLQYQQHNDEIKQLKAQIATMKSQAEAMSEQRRRAIETKCDLVLAQTEMERCHEQELICRDDEMKDMKKYVQEIVEKGAMNEVNFMNEISSLSKAIHDLKEKHRDELREKDYMIAQLEMKMNNAKTQSARGSSQAAFKSRFLEKIEESSECTSVSTDTAPQPTVVASA